MLVIWGKNHIVASISGHPGPFENQELSLVLLGQMTAKNWNELCFGWLKNSK